MVIEFTQPYKALDADHKRWAMTVARQAVVKELAVKAIIGWQYTMRFEELHSVALHGIIRYTFRITLDELPL